MKVGNQESILPLWHEETSGVLGQIKWGREAQEEDTRLPFNEASESVKRKKRWLHFNVHFIDSSQVKLLVHIHLGRNYRVTLPIKTYLMADGLTEEDICSLRKSTGCANNLKTFGGLGWQVKSVQSK